MLGIKATHKTQFLDIENKYGRDWYPVGDEIKNTISPRQNRNNSLYIIQAYLDINHVEDSEYRDRFSDTVFKRSKNWVNGIQFDMLPWHTHPAMIQFLEKLKSKYDTKVFLQCHKNAMEMLGPKGVVEKLKQYTHTIDYVLFDSSHGTGTKLDTDKLRHFLTESYNTESLDAVGFAIAGGLNSEIVEKELPNITKDFPDISWDAEGQLHTELDNYTRPLNIEITKDYLKESSKIINK